MFSQTNRHLGIRTQTTSNNWFQDIFHRILTAQSIWRERRSLNTIDPHLLDDMGLSRKDAIREANRPAWDAPERWMR